jgi:hypothetical protein
MLSKQCCPHTGIVNFFTKADPFLSVGSIKKQADGEGVYCWRWYDAGRTIAGIASDMRSAEERLRRAYRRHQNRTAPRRLDH